MAGSVISGGLYPHSVVTDADGFVIGTLVAVDPPSTKDDSIEGPGYIVGADGPDFTRTFKILGSQPMPRNRDFMLEVTSNSDKMNVSCAPPLKECPKQLIVDRGVPQSPTWILTPRLGVDATEFKDGEVHLQGAVTEFNAGDHKTSIGPSFSVVIPNEHFFLRRQTKNEIALERAKKLKQSLIEWIATIEAIVIAIVGFFSFSWIVKKKKKEREKKSEHHEPDGGHKD